MCQLLLFSILKQVQYVTILKKLNSPEGGAGGREDGLGGLKVKDRFVGGKEGGSDVLPGASSM